MGHSLGESLVHPMFITAILLVQPKGYLEPCNWVGSQSPAECISWIWIGWKRSILANWQGGTLTYFITKKKWKRQKHIFVNEKQEKNVKKLYVNIKHSVHWGINPPPPLKNTTTYFLANPPPPPPYKLTNCPSSSVNILNFFSESPKN